MTLKEAIAQNTKLRQATLLFLIKEGEILLAMKKRGFGVNKWNGVGGKVQPGESVEEAAKRETREEIGVEVDHLEKMGELNFYFENKSDWNQQVIVYRSQNWRGEPQESEEMAPKWVRFDEVPYKEMWEDDADWLPHLIAGKQFEAYFLFDEEEKVKEKEIKVL